MSNKFIPRLYIEDNLNEGEIISLSQSTSHYLRSVKRLDVGARVYVFNETDGEFSAKIDTLTKSGASFLVKECVRKTYFGADITLLCSPIHKDNFRFIMEKGTELGVRVFQPVITEHTNAPKVRIDKAKEYAYQAMEQCERLDKPIVHQPEKISTILKRWKKNVPIVYCSEKGGQPVSEIGDKIKGGSFAVLVGPECGFSEDEHAYLSTQEHILPVSLGPRIMCAETATIAVLSALQCIAGDWEDDIEYIV